MSTDLEHSSLQSQLKSPRHIIPKHTLRIVLARRLPQEIDIRLTIALERRLALTRIICIDKPLRLPLLFCLLLQCRECTICDRLYRITVCCTGPERAQQENDAVSIRWAGAKRVPVGTMFDEDRGEGLECEAPDCRRWKRAAGRRERLVENVKHGTEQAWSCAKRSRQEQAVQWRQARLIRERAQPLDRRAVGDIRHGEEFVIDGWAQDGLRVNWRRGERPCACRVHQTHHDGGVDIIVRCCSDGGEGIEDGVTLGYVVTHGATKDAVVFDRGKVVTRHDAKIVQPTFERAEEVGIVGSIDVDDLSISQHHLDIDERVAGEADLW